MKRPLVFPVLCLAGLLCGCATSVPTSFSRTTEKGWTSIEIRDGVSYDHAWQTVFGVLSHDFDLATVLRDEGYIQTGWLNTWSGTYLAHYKVRATVKFAPDRKSLQVRSEAWSFDGETWVVGTDARLMSTLKTDLMGTVGRTTR